MLKNRSYLLVFGLLILIAAACLLIRNKSKTVADDTSHDVIQKTMLPVAPTSTQSSKVIDQKQASIATETTNADSLAQVPMSDFTDVHCSDYSNYYVVSAEEKDSDPGDDILVKYKVAPNQTFSCDFATSSDDFIVAGGGGGYEFFLNVVDHFLLTDQGTSPGQRTLRIYDLANKESLFKDDYSGLSVTGTDTVEYWTYMGVKATRDNCQQYDEYNGSQSNDGMNSTILNRVSLDLTSLTKTDLHQSKCVYAE